jgi:hypothetical protein
MGPHVTALERAFQLAGSGRTNSIDDIKQELKKEHYSTGQITGNALKKQLLALVNSSSACVTPRGAGWESLIVRFRISRARLCRRPPPRGKIETLQVEIAKLKELAAGHRRILSGSGTVSTGNHERIIAGDHRCDDSQGGSGLSEGRGGSAVLAFAATLGRLAAHFGEANLTCRPAVRPRPHVIDGPR